MKLFLALAAVALLAGCDTFRDSEPEYQRVAGSLSMTESNPATITVPELVRAGEDVPVTVYTTGSTCEKEGDTEFAFVNGVLEIQPFDLTRVLQENEDCGLLLQYFEHTIIVRFSEPGPATVRATGSTPGASGTMQPQTYTLGIVVR